MSGMKRGHISPPGELTAPTIVGGAYWYDQNGVIRAQVDGEGVATAGFPAKSVSLVAGEPIGEIVSRGYTGAAYTDSARIGFFATEGWGLVSQGAAIEFMTTANTSTTPVARWEITEAGNLVALGGHFVELVERIAPAAPLADKARLYARDNGAGKTQLVVLFSSGAVQVIATEP